MDLEHKNFRIQPFSFSDEEKNQKAESNSVASVPSEKIQTGELVVSLQSPDFVSGTSGWKIFPDGTVEFNDGTFRGTLSAASGSLGAITVGTNAWHVDASGNMWWGSSADYAGASIKISSAGVVAFTSGSFRGTLNADDITAGTLTGRTVKAKGTGSTSDIWMDSATGSISFRYDASEIGYLYGSTSAQVLLHSNNDLYLQSDDQLAIDCGSSFYTFADAGMSFDYNYNGGTDLVTFYDNSVLTAYFNDGGDLWIADTLSAGTVVDRTPHYDGNAISDIRQIKGKNGEIDHDSLPDFMKVHRRKKLAKRNAETEKMEIIGDEPVVERNLGASISVLLKAVVELDDKIEAIKSKK